MEAGRKAETIEAIESKLPMPNDNQKPATKRAPKLGQIGRTNSAVKNGKTIFASQNVSLDIPRKVLNIPVTQKVQNYKIFFEFERLFRTFKSFDFNDLSSIEDN